MTDILNDLSQMSVFRGRVQKNRIREGNRISAINRGVSHVSEYAEQIMMLWFEAHNDIEVGIERHMAELLAGECPPIIEHLTALKGIGIITAAKIAGPIDIERATTVSKLWRYAGYSVVDGKREKPVAGEKLHYNRTLKIAVRLACEGMLKAHSPYAEIYGTAKEAFAVTHPDATKMHCHNAALGKQAKVFLCHLWERWRKLEGLPVRDIYSIDRLKHEHYITPERFGWPEM